MITKQPTLLHSRTLVKYATGIIFFIFGLTIPRNMNAQVKIGVFADAQYCDCETHGTRYYRNSLIKLNDCVSHFNKDTLDFIVGLGDLIDRDFSSFDKINTILKNADHPVYQVSGNHDYSVDTDRLDDVPGALGIKQAYYTKTVGNWQFIFLNGNELSLQSTDPGMKKEAEKLLKELTDNKQPNNKKWNGGLGKKQLSWLEKQLKTAERKELNSMIFCHYPLLPHEAHALWDSDKALKIIAKYKGAKAWINGHNHAGNYVLKDGIHFITMKGMVETERDNAFSIFTINNDEIIIDGFDREKDRILKVSK